MWYNEFDIVYNIKKVKRWVIKIKRSRTVVGQDQTVVVALIDAKMTRIQKCIPKHYFRIQKSIPNILYGIKRGDLLKGLIIDQDTGEVVGTFDDGDKILKKNTTEYLKSNVKIPKEEQFTKMYRESISILTECSLTGAEYAIVLYLASNLRYQSNIAKYDNGKLINRENLQRDTQLNAETVKRAIRRLIGFGILVEVTSTAGKVFIMNPFIFNVGDTIEKTVYDLFKKTKWCRWG